MRPDETDASSDGFLNGSIRLWQPRASGLRAGHDALLVACAVPRGASGSLVDMGAGTGLVGFAAGARAPALSVLLAERDAELCQLLRRSVADADAALRLRLDVASLDLLGGRSEREAAGVRDGAFDWVATNPPFHPANGRISPDPRRASALSMPDRDFLLHWIRAASALLRHGGRLVLLARPDSMAAILAASENRLGALTLLPVHGERGPATRLLVGAVRGSRAPLRLLPSFTLDAAARRRLSQGEDMPGLFDGA